MACSCTGGSKEDEEAYCDVMYKDIQDMTWENPEHPSRIYDFLYLGDGKDATNVNSLSALGITYVVNTAAQYVETGAALYAQHGIRYLGIEAEDEPDYDMLQHVAPVYDVIEKERRAGGKVFVHCIAGVNRSAALTVAYCMLHEKWGPIKAARFVRSKRKRILSNIEFHKQLVHFANEHKLLAQDQSIVKKTKKRK